MKGCLEERREPDVKYKRFEAGFKESGDVRIIIQENDWKEYVIDLKKGWGGGKERHPVEPARYPCIVVTEWDGSKYQHQFSYDHPRLDPVRGTKSKQRPFEEWK